MTVILIAITFVLIGSTVLLISDLKGAKSDYRGVLSFPFFDRGKQGEWFVNDNLSALPEGYHVINDLLIRFGSYQSSQIDHVVVSTKGIFVIETKNLGGTIVGDGNNDNWTHYLGREKYNLYNPEKQNSGHINCLKQLLRSVADKDFHSIVVFTNRSELRLRNLKGAVIHTSQIRNYILQFQEPCIPEEKIPQMVALLTKYTSYSREEEMAHEGKVGEIQSRRRERIAAGKCPNCGGELVERHGSYGTFWGCSNYPKCKYTTNDRPIKHPQSWL